MHNKEVYKFEKNYTRLVDNAKLSKLRPTLF